MTKEQLGEMLAVYKDQVAFLKVELEESRKREEKFNEQVYRLQDALMSIRAPAAYRDMKNDQGIPDASAELTEARQKEAKLLSIQAQYARQMEGDIFKSQADIEDLMNTVLLAGNKVGSKSLHGNSES